jgi:8-oxo-dGTP pyrophosphatase MutT (NUDIX family)
MTCSFLFARLRWTRNGLKSAFHSLVGANPPCGRATLGNCTDAELALLAGPFDELWTHALLPPTWRLHGAEPESSARANHGWLSAAAASEISRRASGGAVQQDELSRNALVLPKGGAQPGESDWDAALREFCEETGVPASDVLRMPDEQPLRSDGLCVFPVALKGKWEDVASWALPECAETCGAEWVSLEQAQSLFLPKAMRGVVSAAAPIAWRLVGELDALLVGQV